MSVADTVTNSRRPNKHITTPKYVHRCVIYCHLSPRGLNSGLGAVGVRVGPTGGLWEPRGVGVFALGVCVGFWRARGSHLLPSSFPQVDLTSRRGQEQITSEIYDSPLTCKSHQAPRFKCSHVPRGECFLGNNTNTRQLRKKLEG